MDLEVVSVVEEAEKEVEKEEEKEVALEEAQEVRLDTEVAHLKEKDKNNSIEIMKIEIQEDQGAQEELEALEVDIEEKEEVEDILKLEKDIDTKIEVVQDKQEELIEMKNLDYKLISYK